MMPSPALKDIDSPFICECEEQNRAACAGMPFYKAREGKSYCVYHFPGEEKHEAFEKSLGEKLAAKDFNFRGIWFPGKLSFRNFNFITQADFSHATFNGQVVFSAAKFRGQAYFRFATFKSGVNFGLTSFRGESDFNSAKFSSRIDFTNATFEANAIFSDTIFNAEARFDYAVFAGQADFRLANFCGQAVFGSVKFNRDTDFYLTKFKAEADFGCAKLNGKANFYSAMFAGEADFRKAIFNAAANFAYAEFGAHVYFTNAALNAEANFNYVKFGGETDFNTYFNAAVSFVYATFGAEAYFRYAIFGARVSLRSVTFRDYVRFGEGSFGERSSLDLQHTRIEKPDHVSFHTLTLRPHWFVNVDPRKFDFTAIEWHDFTVEREIEALKSQGILPAHRLLAVACRNLAVNAEENHRYEEGSKFRYMAMDARRLESWRGFSPWRLSWWYWLASGYGEHVPRAFSMLLVVWFLFAVLYTWAGFARWEPRRTNEGEAATEQRDEVGEPLKLPRAFTYSLGVMTFQKPEPRPATTVAQSLVILETILGPLQAALLALAIRRKFMR